MENIKLHQEDEYTQSARHIGPISPTHVSRATMAVWIVPIVSDYRDAFAYSTFNRYICEGVRVGVVLAVDVSKHEFAPFTRMVQSPHQVQALLVVRNKVRGLALPRSS